MRLKRFGWSLMVACSGVAAIVLWHQSPQAVGQSQSTRTNVPKKRATVPGQIDTQSSRAYVYVGKTGLGHQHAVIGQIKNGQIYLGASKDAGKIVFDMTTFKAGTNQARRYIGLKGSASVSTARAVTANMLGKDVLDARRFPTATFTIASALPLKQTSPNGKPQYQLDGKFTLHGVTRKLRLNAEVAEQNGKVHLRGGFSILQTSFGIRPFSKAFGTVGVANKLTIYGEIDVAGTKKLTQHSSLAPPASATNTQSNTVPQRDRPTKTAA